MIQKPFIRPVFLFFLLVFLGAIPLTALGFLVKTPEGTPLHLPASAVLFILPALAALTLARRYSGKTGPRKLISSVFQFKATKPLVWYSIALATMPSIGLLAYWTMALSGYHGALPSVSILGFIGLLLVYLFAAACEELGWMGYAFNPMQKRWGAVYASIILGLAWAAMHLIPWIQVRGITWAAGWALFSITIRVVMTWLYNNTGKALPTVIFFHASINIVASVFPGFDFATAPYAFAILATGLAIVIVTYWDHQRLTTLRTGVVRG